uniref:Uncharacterized protein n=1 Tax=Trichobilharzia regenti TaxID=157069 RepID=A0AA85KDS2_TRIRE|nr:unnamed protein product [Trichobilharzia regenti]
MMMMLRMFAILLLGLVSSLSYTHCHDSKRHGVVGQQIDRILTPPEVVPQPVGSANAPARKNKPSPRRKQRPVVELSGPNVHPAAPTHAPVKPAAPHAHPGGPTPAPAKPTPAHVHPAAPTHAPAKPTPAHVHPAGPTPAPAKPTPAHVHPAGPTPAPAKPTPAHVHPAGPTPAPAKPTPAHVHPAGPTPAPAKPTPAHVHPAGPTPAPAKPTPAHVHPAPPTPAPAMPTGPHVQPDVPTHAPVKPAAPHARPANSTSEPHVVVHNITVPEKDQQHHPGGPMEGPDGKGHDDRSKEIQPEKGDHRSIWKRMCDDFFELFAEEEFHPVKHKGYLYNFWYLFRQRFLNIKNIKLLAFGK